MREHVAAARLRAREMFVPLSHRPGHAQADFGEADGYIGGKKVRFHYFCMDLPHSDGCFVKAYPAETAEAFCDGHLAARHRVQTALGHNLNGRRYTSDRLVDKCS